MLRLKGPSRLEDKLGFKVRLKFETTIGNSRNKQKRNWIVTFIMYLQKIISFVRHLKLKGKLINRINKIQETLQRIDQPYQENQENVPDQTNNSKFLKCKPWMLKTWVNQSKSLEISIHEARLSFN